MNSKAFLKHIEALDTKLGQIESLASTIDVPKIIGSYEGNVLQGCQKSDLICQDSKCNLIGKVL